jgi:uncharacterized protein (DUF2252 family)
MAAPTQAEGIRRAHCARVHGLQLARSPTYSADGTRVYVVCGCGQRRVVEPAEWQEEQARRTKEAAREHAAG